MACPRPILSTFLGALAALVPSLALAANLNVIATTPARNTTAPITTTVSITFDRAVAPGSVNAATLRVFGRWSGNAPGTISLSNANQTVTFARSRPFTSGEVVLVSLSHDLVAADASPLRAAGYSFSFWTRTGTAARVFQEIDVMSNRGTTPQTRIYGSSATDLNEDGYLDLATVNEVSADVRVFMNRADGTGLFFPILPREPIGQEGSPNETADFNNDGHADLCVAAAVDNSVWVLLGAGDGTYPTRLEIPVGGAPHGVTTLDVDGDADPDIVNSNTDDDGMSVILNNGNGTFQAPAFFDAGVTSEYGLSVGDMNGDGILDVVAGARDGGEVVSLLNDGDGTFTPVLPAQDIGGPSWMVACGDVNGDGHLDVASANSFAGNAAVLLGNGDGSFQPPVTHNVGAHTPAIDLGDLDGDGDLDMVSSVYGAGYWRIFVNDGVGSFSFDQDILAPSNPSCAVLCDFDNDLDLDLVLTDEIADVVVLRRNMGSPAGVADEGLATGGAIAIPNPFRGIARIRFRLPRPGPISLEVLDLSGRLVISRRSEAAAAGWTEFALDGRDDGGRRLETGVYLYRVRGPGVTGSGRLIHLR